ncbi:unnamed protein product, partial [Prorocentrum cordatum]
RQLGSGCRLARGLRVRARRPLGRCPPRALSPPFLRGAPSAVGDVGPALACLRGACAAAHARRALARAAHALLRAFGALKHRGCRPARVGAALAVALGSAAASRAPAAPPPRAAAPPESAPGDVRNADDGAHDGASGAAAAAASGSAAGGQAAAPSATVVLPRVSPSPVRLRGTGSSSAAAGAAAAEIPLRGLARSLDPEPRGSKQKVEPAATLGGGMRSIPVGPGLEPASGLARVVGQAPAGPSTSSSEGARGGQMRLALRDSVEAFSLQRGNWQALRLSGAPLRLLERMGVADALQTALQLAAFNVSGPPPTAGF